VSTASRPVYLLVTVDLEDDDHRDFAEICDDLERQLAGGSPVVTADVVLLGGTDDGLPSSPDPATAQRQALAGKELTAYLGAVIRAMIRSDPRIARYLSPICPECGRLAATEDGVHIVLGSVVVVGCEGYRVINPNAVGIPDPDWQPRP
jgi:hypothetical protein